MITLTIKKHKTPKWVSRHRVFEAGDAYRRPLQLQIPLPGGSLATIEFYELVKTTSAPVDNRFDPIGDWIKNPAVSVDLGDVDKIKLVHGRELYFQNRDRKSVALEGLTPNEVDRIWGRWHKPPVAHFEFKKGPE